MTKVDTLVDTLTEAFVSSRRQGLSPNTVAFYHGYLRLSNAVVGFNVTGADLSRFLGSRNCGNGGKHAYYRTLRAFYNWLYSPKSGYGLDPQDNPMLSVDPPKVERRMLPSLTVEQICHLIEQTDCVRDKAIISLFADSGLRLSELASVALENIDWNSRLIRVWCKGGKEGLAPFGERTESLLRQWLSGYEPTSGNVWGIDKWGIETMLKGLRAKTGLPCNAHTFRRSFASILAKRGVDSLHIMRLGRWESISMVDRYTKSVKFEDSLKLYSPITK